jgi:HEAT repeat protein
MRSKVIVSVLALVLVAAGVWFLVRQTPAGPAGEQTPQTTDEMADAAPSSAVAASVLPSAGKGSERATAGLKAAPADPDETMADTPEAKQEAYVIKRVDELQDLGMENDSESLDTILSELNNRDPRIREAAVDAVVQFGSRDAIPKLEDAAAQTENPKEKAAILDAIEFLKLPTLTEALGQQTQTAPDASNGKNP